MADVLRGLSADEAEQRLEGFGTEDLAHGIEWLLAHRPGHATFKAR